MTDEDEVTIRGIQKQSLVSATIWAAAVILAIALMNNRLWLSSTLFGAETPEGLLALALFGLLSMIVMVAGTIMAAIESVNVFWTLYLLGDEDD